MSEFWHNVALGAEFTIGGFAVLCVICAIVFGAAMLLEGDDDGS